MSKYLSDYPNYYPRNTHEMATDSEPEQYIRIMTSEKSGAFFLVTKRYYRTYHDNLRIRRAERWVGCTFDSHGRRINRDWDKRSVKQSYPVTAFKRTFK